MNGKVMAKTEIALEVKPTWEAKVKRYRGKSSEHIGGADLWGICSENKIK